MDSDSSAPGLIFLFTDFGAEGPYLGQMEAVLRMNAPGVPVINLVSNAPCGDPRHSAYLLAALSRHCPPDSVILGVVDPGVGGERLPVVLQEDGRWFVGPDNGLFNTVAAQASRVEWRVIDWRPDTLSASFHGRDLFASIAARIARNDFTWGQVWQGPDLQDWPADLAEIIYIDHYGNAITGLRYRAELDGQVLWVNGRSIPQASTFCEVGEGQAFWYRNSMDLVEVAVNRDRADRCLGLVVGMPIHLA
ncbi:SAM hydrolase/SAM-dependent halogenase family protein [Methylomagnum sp.]